ncbi:hypothetical protein ES705_19837 [subsurface metagenome]
MREKVESIINTEPLGHPSRKTEGKVKQLRLICITLAEAIDIIDEFKQDKPHIS